MEGTTKGDYICIGNSNGPNTHLQIEDVPTWQNGQIPGNIPAWTDTNGGPSGQEVIQSLQKSLKQAVDAHDSDTRRILEYLKLADANPRSGADMVSQILQFCNELLKQRENAYQEVNVALMRDEEATRKLDEQQGQYKKLLKENKVLERNLTETKEKLAKADQRRKDEVDQARRQAEMAHQYQMQCNQSAYVTDIKAHKIEIDKLRKDVERLEYEKTELQALMTQRTHTSDIQIKLKDDQNSKLLDEIVAVQMGHSDEVKKLREEKAVELQKKEDVHNAELDGLIDVYEACLRKLKAKVQELASDVIQQTDDFRPATDQALYIKFLRLRNRVKDVSLPDNLYQHPPPNGTGDGAAGSRALTVPATLDRTGFAKRHEARDLQFLLQWLVWKELIDGFFSTPFGFGILGRDVGLKKIMSIHDAWAHLYDGQAKGKYQSFPYSTELAIYKRDTNANKFRSAMFQSFMPVLFPHIDQSSQNQPQKQQQLQQQQRDLAPQQFMHPNPSHPLPLPPLSFLQRPTPSGVVSSSNSGNDANAKAAIAALFHGHCQAVTDRIQQLLHQFTECKDLRASALESVAEIVRQAAELGLECGVQRAQVVLLAPSYREMVCIGDMYQNCLGGPDNSSSGGLVDSTDGQTGTGQNVSVDLMVAPGLMRIGDGRSDITTSKVLVPCKVYPL